MAQVATNIIDDKPGIFERFGMFLVRLAENNARVQKVERLQSMSDEQLARIGLRRDQIVQHVFADLMYT